MNKIYTFFLFVIIRRLVMLTRKASALPPVMAKIISRHRKVRSKCEFYFEVNYFGLYMQWDWLCMRCEMYVCYWLIKAAYKNNCGEITIENWIKKKSPSWMVAVIHSILRANNHLCLCLPMINKYNWAIDWHQYQNEIRYCEQQFTLLDRPM